MLEHVRGLDDIIDGQGLKSSTLGKRLVSNEVIEEDDHGNMEDAVTEFSSALLQLVNVPLKFTSAGLTMTWRVYRRGRPPSRAVRGQSRKRCCGIQLIEMDGDSMHAAKKKLQVGDDHSNSISAETAAQSHREP
ncbi:UNVERIFIED_CONTAM: hypothetical protein Slati_1460900 [Sesamum latifolium]|uniref:Uncharacterized protein n=1 Tax=Sesamum latifolium TaxID=2727402 RepID=A0AAW2X6D9_9LAMI